MALDPERRRRLDAAKLRALVRGLADADVSSRAAEAPFGAGAGLLVGTEGWVLASERPDRCLGPALLWARRHGVQRLHVVVDDSVAAPVVARRAQLFRDPPEVLAVEGAAAVPVQPAAPMAFCEVPPEVAAFADLIREAGAVPVVEDGTLVAEVLGLEVGRVVVGPAGAVLEVGVGRNDRLAHAMLHGEAPPAAVLREVVARVLALRRPGAPRHPFNQIARERWLRALLLARPDTVGARHLVAAPTPVSRRDLREPAPAVAIGEDTEGRSLVAVCSAGVDPDLVPVAADARLALAPGARLVLALACRDDHPATRALAARLLAPAEIRIVEPVPYP